MQRVDERARLMELREHLLILREEYRTLADDLLAGRLAPGDVLPELDATLRAIGAIVRETDAIITARHRPR